MGLAQEVRQTYNALLNSGNVRYATQPAAGAAGATVTCGKQALGAWAQIVAAATITDPSWLVGCAIGNPAAAGFVAAGGIQNRIDINVGTGAAAAEVAIAAFIWGTVDIEVTAVGHGAFALPAQYLPYPVRLAGAPRLAAQGATRDAAATRAVDVIAILATLVGT